MIVVDNGSTDNTREICASYAHRIPELQYLYEETAGLHAARHRGMKAAKSDILAYGDDDIEASSTWLEGIVEAFSDEQVVLVGGKNLPKFESDPPIWLRRMWEKERQGGRMIPYLSILDLGDEIKTISPYHVFGCNFSIRKSILLEAGGFHPDAMPPELIRYRGDGETHVSRYIANRDYKTIYNPKASVQHLVARERMTESYFYNRAFLQGISDSYADIRRRMLRPSVKFQYLTVIRRLFRLLEDVRSMRIKVKYIEGYCFHQNEVKKDSGLYEWVIKRDYIA